MHKQNGASGTGFSQSLKFVAVLALTFASAACTYDVAPPPVPDLEIPTGYTNKVVGTWALIVDQPQLTAHVVPDGFACGAFDYPMDFRTTFQRSLIQAFRQVSDDVVWTDHRLSMNALTAKGFAGEIEFKDLVFTPVVSFEQNSLTAKVSANVELDATMTVETPSGVLLARRFSASVSANTDAGIVCQDVPAAITRAVSSAEQQLLVNAAAAFGDSRDVRVFAAEHRPRMTAQSH